MNYKIIKDESQYEDYCEILHDLVKNIDTRDSDEVELLVLLTEKWEADTMISKDLDPIELISELMSSHGMNASELGEVLDLSKGTISKMLNYQKGLSKESIRKLAERFKIAQSAFNKPYRLKVRATSSRRTN